jgi:hypothetical protein
VRTLYAVLFASHHDLHLQRAALFSLVRRAPTSLGLAAKLLDAKVPEVSRLFRVDPRVTPTVQRSYERALAAAVLGATGLETARPPLRAALSKSTTVADRVLFTVALSRLTPPAEASQLMLDTIARTPLDATVDHAHAAGLVQLVAGLEDLLLPCSFEIVRMGSRPLALEVLAHAAEDRADEQLASLLLRLAQRVALTNAHASDTLALTAALLAAPSTFAELHGWVQGLPPDDDRNIDGWVTDIAPAYSRCGEDLACHVCVLHQPDVEMWRYKSAQFVAARLAPDQGPALLTLMERMTLPFWLANALDARLTAPTPEQIARVRRLPRPDPDDAPLYAPRTSSCARLDSRFEELAIRLEVRARASQSSADRTRDQLLR